ncbi:MAG: class I SAM-dependent methyltransferase [Acidobacteriota bacterium]
MSGCEYPWPPIENGSRPEWTGSAFRVGGLEMPVLGYNSGPSGWSDSLTQMHEELAGTGHPIDRLSRNWALAAVQRHVTQAAPVLLEMGCSSGFFLDDLRARFPAATVIGSDFLQEPLERLAARVRDVPLLRFDAVRCPLPDASLDAVILLNVLEHIENDGEAVRQVARILKPGGVAVIEVPAGPHLYDLYDEHLQHYRRYSGASLAALAAAAGLAVVEQSHLGCFLYPGFALVKRWNQRRSDAQPAARERIVAANITQTGGSWLLRQVFEWEGRLGRWMSFPFGIRCVMVCQRPAKMAASIERS